MSKGRVIWAAVICTAFALTGCAAPSTSDVADDEVAQGVTTDVASDQEAPGAEGVAPGDDTVTITIPKEFFEDSTEEGILAGAAESGFTTAVVNADGSVTYTMPRSLHDEMLKEMTDAIDETIAEALRDSPDIFSDVTYNDTVTRFSVIVNRSVFESRFDAPFIGFGLGLGGLLYQIYQGVPQNDQEVLIDFVDGDSGDVFDSQRWPGEG